MSLSWITNRSLKVSPRVRLVDDADAAALRRKLETLEWKPENGFLKDQVSERPHTAATTAVRAACGGRLKDARAPSHPSGARRDAACRACGSG